jgi:hypothetical protein
MTPNTSMSDTTADICSCDDAVMDDLSWLLSRFGLTLARVPAREPIPGTFWGEPEAGLIRNKLYLRCDTPVHSALHEACHFICLDPARRALVHTDAGGDAAEENAVCYLQILLSEYLPGMDRERMFHDMDAWGYSFRLGSAKAWFERDAADARDWLVREGLIHASEKPSWRLRC